MFIFYRYYKCVAKGKDCTEADMKCILSYLAAQVTINNAGRPCVFQNAMWEEYVKREILNNGKGKN